MKYHLNTGIGKMATERGSLAADLDMHIMAVDAAARDRDRESLEKYISIAEESAASVNHSLYMAIARRARGIASGMQGDLDPATDQLATAADEFRELKTPWQLGYTLLELGEVEQSRGNDDLAREHYSEALTAFESLGAIPYVNRARAALD